MDSATGVSTGVKVTYRLEARSPFHLGERGVGMEESSVMLHADTLFSALCLALREMGEDLDGMLANFPRLQNGAWQDGKPPFWISSAFPFSGAVHFFPKPFLRPTGLNDEAGPSLGKTYKKVQFVSQKIYEKLLNGQALKDDLLEAAKPPENELKVRSELFVQGGKLWATAGEMSGLVLIRDPLTGKRYAWSEERRPHVTVDRAASRSQVFSVGEVRFAEKSGLFFLVSYADIAMRPRVEAALRILSETGIGGERSSGRGQFALGIQEGFPLAEAPAGNAFTTLSPYWPRQDEVNGGILDGARYALMLRRGWVGSPEGRNLRKWDLRLLGEGSVFPKLMTGGLVDVGPRGMDGAPLLQHPVWRCGLAFPMRCRMDGE